MKKLFLWLGKAALIGLVTILLVEVALWLFMRMDEELPVEVTYTQEIPGLKKEIIYERNALGLRTLSLHEVKKPDRCVRILVLGASSTDQATMNTEDMWLAQLEKGLNMKLQSRGITVQVAGRAAVGMRLRNQVKWVRQRMDRLQPDVVVTFLGINEMVSAESQNRTFSPEVMRTYLEIRTTEERLHGFSQIARYVTASRYEYERREQDESSRGVNVSIAWLDELRDLYQKIPIQDDLAGRPERLRTFTYLFDYLIKDLTDRSLEVIVMGTPVLAKDGMTDHEKSHLWFFLPYEGEDMKKPDQLRVLSPAVFREEMNRFNDRQREIASTYGVPYLPLESMVDPTLENFFDDCHFTLEGTRRVAESILPELEVAVDQVIAKRRW